MTRPNRRPNRDGRGATGRRGGRRRKTARATTRVATGPTGTIPACPPAGAPVGPLAGRVETPQRDRPDAGSTGQRGAASERCRGRRTSGEAPDRACVNATRNSAPGEHRATLRGHPTGPATPAGPWWPVARSRGAVAGRTLRRTPVRTDAAASPPRGGDWATAAARPEPRRSKPRRGRPSRYGRNVRSGPSILPRRRNARERQASGRQRTRRHRSRTRTSGEANGRSIEPLRKKKGDRRVPVALFVLFGSPVSPTSSRRRATVCRWTKSARPGQGPGRPTPAGAAVPILAAGRMSGSPRRRPRPGRN